MESTEFFIENRKAMIKPTSFVEWLKELYGKRILVDGKYLYCPKYTTLYPHKTDSCGNCERLKGYLRSCEMALLRHGQQADQGTIPRQEAVKAASDQKSDIQDALITSDELISPLPPSLAVIIRQ